MSLESDLFAVISAVCPRAYPDYAPFDTQRPFVIWSQIGGSVINPMANEVPDKRNAFVQINVWHDTRYGAVEVSQQIEAALIQATQFQARPMSAIVNASDEDLGIRGAMQDFSIWASR
jgi:hypothetical protein